MAINTEEFIREFFTDPLGNTAEGVKGIINHAPTPFWFWLTSIIAVTALTLVSFFFGMIALNVLYFIADITNWGGLAFLMVVLSIPVAMAMLVFPFIVYAQSDSGGHSGFLTATIYIYALLFWVFIFESGLGGLAFR